MASYMRYKAIITDVQNIRKQIEKYFRIDGGDSCVCGRRAYFVATRSVGIDEGMCNNNKVISRPFYTIQLCTEYNEI